MTLPYAHLSLAERREIARMHATKIPVRVMSEHLQRHPSTLYREIKRNWVHDEEPLYRGYYPVAADMQARARRQRLSKLARKPVLATYVMDRLKAGWPPDQIAGRLRTTGAPERLSHETIYRFVYGSQGQKLGLYQDLPMARRRRRVRYQRTPRLSITFDRGTEFAYYPLLKQQLGMDSYFCKPQAPWQKGSVENTNGRVRRFLSRDTDIAELSDEALRELCGRLSPSNPSPAVKR